MRAPACAHEGCDKPIRARGLCPTHWWQMKNRGTTWDVGAHWKRLSQDEIDGALLLIARGASTDDVAELFGVSTGKSLTAHLRKSAKDGLRDALIARQTAEHGTQPRYRQGCRCSDCSRAHADRKRSAEVVASGVLRRRMTREAVEQRDIQRHFLEAAERRGYQWTGPEIETALATDGDGEWLRTAYEVAQVTGRSLSGVAYIRRKRNDPRVRGML